MRDDLIDLYVNFEHEVGKFHFETLFPPNFIKYTHQKTKIKDLPHDFELIQKHVLQDYKSAKSFIEIKYTPKQIELIFKKLDLTFEKYQGIPWYEFVFWVKRNENGNLIEISKDIVDEKTLVQIKEHIEGLHKSIVQEYLKIRYEILEPKIRVSEFNETIAVMKSEFAKKLEEDRKRKTNNLKNLHWIGNPDFLDQLHKRLLKDTLLFDKSKSITYFRKCFDGKKLDNQIFLSINLDTEEIMCLILYLFREEYIEFSKIQDNIKKTNDREHIIEQSWNIQQIQALFRKTDGSKHIYNKLRRDKQKIVVNEKISKQIEKKITSLINFK